MRVFSSVSRLSLSASVVAIGTVLATPAMAQTPPTAQPGVPPEACKNIAQSAAKQDCANRAEQVDPNASQGDLATSPTGGGVANAQASSPNDKSIVVTGSRLHRDERTSVDPVSVIDPNVENRQGRLDTAEILQSNPLAQGSTQITSILSTNFVINGGEGVENVDLRGLGPNRTLVLLNGRRAGPAGTRGGVGAFDLNVLPADIIQSVEILKTGASSVYGSDAVAGVVNIITRKDIRGLQVRVTDTEPFKVGGGEFSITGIAGMGLGSRGHVMILGNYYKRQALTRGERGFLGCETENVTSETTGRRADPINPNTGQPYCGTFPNNVIFVNDFSYYFTADRSSNLCGPILPRSPKNLNRQDVCATQTAPTSGQGRRPITAIQYDQPGDNLSKYLNPLAPCDPAVNGPGPYGEPACLSVPNGVFPVGSYSANGLALEHLYNPQLNQDSVSPETKRYTVYGEASYDITDNVNLFFEGLYNRRKTNTVAHRQLFFDQFTGNTFLPYYFCDTTDNPDCQGKHGDPLNKAFSGDVLLEPIVIAPFNSSTDVKYWRVAAGVHADLSRILPHGAIDFYYQHSNNDGDYSRQIIFRDAVEFGVAQFRTQTCAGTLTAIRHVPCIDINYTDPRVLAGNFTPQESAFLFGVDKGNTRYKQDGGELTVSGDVFRLPYGPVQVLLGADLRRDSINDVPGDAVDPNLINNIWGSTTSGVTAGYERTTEFSGEIEIPLLKNLSFAKDLSLNGAARLTSVYAHRADGASQSNNGNFTYKVGANYAPTDWLRFRGTYGTSFRSPALFEEFLSNETGFQGQGLDPCIRYGQSQNATLKANCLAAGIPSNYSGSGPSFTSASGGGVGHLQPETSKALTVGGVITPLGWFWNNAQFSLAVDYSDIRVKNEITQLGAANILAGCYTSTHFSTEPLCSLFTRAPATAANKFNILTLLDPYLNINQQHNKALDFTLRFRQGLGSLGSLSLLGQMSYQLKDTFTLFQGIETSNNGHAGDPKWTSQINLSWVKAPFTVTYGLNLISGTSDLTGDNGAGLLALGPDAANCLATDAAFALRGGPYCPVYKLPMVAYHSISVEVQATKDVSFLFGIANLFDKSPPLVSTVGSPISALGQVPTLGSYYDYLGRRFFVSIKAALPVEHHAIVAPVVAIPAPPPATQSCPDGSVVAVTAMCPVPPPAPVAPPPPPPPAKGERG